MRKPNKEALQLSAKVVTGSHKAREDRVARDRKKPTFSRSELLPPRRDGGGEIRRGRRQKKKEEGRGVEGQEGYSPIRDFPSQPLFPG